MAGDLNGNTGDIVGPVVYRAGGSIVSGLMIWRKTGTGTCSLRVISEHKNAIMGNVDIPTDNPSQGYFEFPLPHGCHIEQYATAGSVSVDASIDGSKSG